MPGRSLRFALLGPVLALGLAAPAAAQVTVVSPPAISGSPVVGAKLTAVGGTISGRPDRVARLWMQCPSPTAGEWSCTWVDGSNSTTFTVRASDRDRWIRVALLAWRGWTLDYKVSSPTAKITAAAPEPVPPRPAPPSPTPTGSPTPAPVPVAPEPPVPAPVPAAAPEPVPVAVAAPTLTTTSSTPRMMRPFPTVRISGRLTARGARLTRLAVKAPRGARIAVTCRGGGCPARRLAHATKVWRVAKFQRELRAGTRLTVTITKRGFISKVTRITIRQGKAPARSDRCRLPGRSRLIRCPKA